MVLVYALPCVVTLLQPLIKPYYSVKENKRDAGRLAFLLGKVVIYQYFERKSQGMTGINGLQSTN